MRPDSSRRGFSLIEIIAAMSVLAIIMLLIGQAYTSVNGSWRDGMNSSDQNSGGRAALAFMARELSQAVLDDKNQMVVVRDDDNGDSAIWFSTLTSQPRKTTAATRRQIQDICYFAGPNPGSDVLVDFAYRILQRAGNYKLQKLHSSAGGNIDAALVKDGSDFTINTQLLPFINKFRLNLYTLDKTDPGARPELAPAKYSSHKDGQLSVNIPCYLDIYLEVLGQDIARLAAQAGLSSGDKKKMLEANLQRFSTRIHFPNIPVNRSGS